MANNHQISKTLLQLADLLEFTGANPFRLKAYRNGARVIAEWPESLAKMVADQHDLTQIDGIGKSVAEKCEELVNTGKLQQLDDLLKKVPATVLDLMNVPKLGPKKAATLFSKLGIETLPQLKQACLDGKVRTLAGFGEKTETAILDGIEIAQAANQRILWATADKLVQRLRSHFQQSPDIEQLEFAGSYRRGKETVGDLDILVVSNAPSKVMDHFAKFPEITSTFARGDTKMSVRIEDEFQIDLRVVPADSFGAALQYFTGSKEHNVIVRSKAKQLGLKINEWGVYQVEEPSSAASDRVAVDDQSHSRSPIDDLEKPIAGATEADVYQAVGLPWIPPELREARREFDWAAADQLPDLITIDAIQGDLHMHTTASDGQATIEQMADAARRRGLRYIAITDHSQRVSVANGLTAERLLAQWDQIDRINQNADEDFMILKGIECDILENGEMDLPDDVLAQADWVIASLHFGQTQPSQQITDRLLNAIHHPGVNLIAHPTGRLLNKREPYLFDLEVVFQAVKAQGKLLELNANPRRLDLNDTHLAIAKSMGIRIIINTDAHRIEGFDDLQYGIKQARRGGLTAVDVANTLPLKELQRLLSPG